MINSFLSLLTLDFLGLPQRSQFRIVSKWQQTIIYMLTIQVYFSLCS